MEVISDIGEGGSLDRGKEIWGRLKRLGKYTRDIRKKYEGKLRECGRRLEIIGGGGG